MLFYWAVLACKVMYLHQFIQIRNGPVSKSIVHLMNACSQLVLIEKDIRQIDSTKNFSQVTKIAETIQTNALALKGEEYLLLPGGWLDPSDGHFMIYQLSKDSNGDLLFSIHNSGSGLKFHAKHSDKEKELYNPIMTFKIPAEMIKTKHFVNLLDGALSTSQHTGGKNHCRWRPFTQ